MYKILKEESQCSYVELGSETALNKLGAHVLAQ